MLGTRRLIKALGTPSSKLSLLGCIWAQIFEQCSVACVPLAEQHRIPRPKQHFWGSVEGLEGGCRSTLNVRYVHHRCLCTGFLSSLPPLIQTWQSLIFRKILDCMLSTRATALKYIIAILLGFHDFKTVRFTKAKSRSEVAWWNYS